MSSGLEVVGRTGTGHQGRAGQQADSRDLSDQGDLFVAPAQCRDLVFSELHLLLEIVDFTEQLGEDHPESGWEVVVVEDSQRMPLDGCRPGGDRMTEFSETTANPVDASRSSGLPLLAHSVELLDLLLIDGADRYRVDAPASVGIDKRLGIGPVGFVSEPIFSDELCRKDDGLVTKGFRLPSPEVSASAGLEQHDGSIRLGEEACSNFLRDNRRWECAFPRGLARAT